MKLAPAVSALLCAVSNSARENRLGQIGVYMHGCIVDEYRALSVAFVDVSNYNNYTTTSAALVLMFALFAP